MPDPPVVFPPCFFSLSSFCFFCVYASSGNPADPLKKVIAISPLRGKKWIKQHLTHFRALKKTGCYFVN